MKKISIISHNLSENCLGRAYILAKVLDKDFEVEIVGPIKGKGIWGPVSEDKTVKYKVISTRPNIFAFMKAVDGDIIYSVKPRPFSFGFALFVKIFKHKRLVLDIDDWEYGYFKDFNFKRLLLNTIAFWHYDDNAFLMWLTEKFIKFADSITVSNGFLQKRFGGTIIPHFRDTDDFDPSKYDYLSLKKQFGVEDKRVVMFLGTVRKHKGVDTIISALDILGRNDIVLMLVGVTDSAREIIPDRKYLKIFGTQPFGEVPKFLAVADVIVLMQKQNSPFAQGQLPAKIFDAMSMAKPVIATNISDIPKILDGCGVVINDNEEELSLAIKSIFDDLKKATEMGFKARERCVKEYSYHAIRPKLVSIFKNLK